MKPNMKFIKDMIEIKGLDILNWENNTCYMLHKELDAIMDINNYLLDVFPLYYGVIDRGNVKQLEEIFPCYPLDDFRYYISIPIYEN